MEFIHQTGRGKTRTFRVRNNRMVFRCSNCRVQRSFSVPQKLRRKKIQCHKCKEITNCILDRRTHNRDRQSGKIELIMANNEKIEARIIDISPEGIGVKLSGKIKKTPMLKLGDQVNLQCNWNRSLLGHGRYVVKNINQRQIGFEKIR